MVCALAGALVFYALSDVLLWQRIFERHGLQQFDSQYQTGRLSALVGLIAVGMVLLYDMGLWAICYGLALYTLAYSGLEDVLYYALDMRPIPSSLPWLDENRLIFFKPVTAPSLLASTALWMGLWILALGVGPGAWHRLIRGRVRRA